MAEHVELIDISDMPDSLQVVEDVRACNEPRILTRNGEKLAILSPVGARHTRRPSKIPSADALASFRAAAGSWADVDTDALVANIYETRRRSVRPPVEL